jgi:hypothetical protein
MDISLLTERLESEIEALESAYYRLVLIVGHHGAGKTHLIRAIQAKLELPLINLNLQLSKRLLELTGRQRILGIPKILEEMLAGINGKATAVDNTEILFDASLRLDPLRVLQTISRNNTIVATWNGNVYKTTLSYAAPGHPEYKRYEAHGVRIVAMNEQATSEGDIRR